jgi:CheY-like chemotaxis protein
VPSILIVDDDQRFRGIARALLECEGFDVVGEADDGAAALAAAARWSRTSFSSTSSSRTSTASRSPNGSRRR